MNTNKQLSEWDISANPLIISAGPCSAESEKQLLETAEGLQQGDISFFRAGIWKPRTRPGCFEGVGEPGLKWLQKVRSEFGYKVGTEVASPEHVKLCLEYGIDVLWIGARTTPNPFAIQAIADALEGHDLPLFVKNPISPDSELWIGAFERLAGAGLTQLGAIHRGFSSSSRSLYRNAPKWAIPIEFKRRFPSIPIICDPSHISGDRALISTLSQAALDLLFDGLMVEVHNDPSCAKSDANQQLKPDAFLAILENLVLKHESVNNHDAEVQLKELRQNIDHLDNDLIELLAKRMDVVCEIGILKESDGASAFQPHRWEEMLKTRIRNGKKSNLSETFITKLFQAIQVEAIAKQDKNIIAK